ncbi:MAG: ATP-dependent sacrificial sulfur transferase LarE [Magnetococcales bacterium]|nr:ATP-dependent sacrificial sulfur transferase LarE [Magnetococcales bacterium]
MNPVQQQLVASIGKNGCLLVAFSGGVDSTYLLAEAVRTLGRERVLALTARSSTLPAHELDQCRHLALHIDARHLVLDSLEMDNPLFTANGPDRCYHCKSSLFDLCDQVIAQQPHPPSWSIAYGANRDDLGDHRPGMTAARQRGILAPLLAAGWGKAKIRAASRELGLPTAAKAAFACLGSRFPTFTLITPAELARVEAAEAVLRDHRFRQFRVRHHGTLARIEVGADELDRFDDHRFSQAISQAIAATGYQRVEIDPQGYRTGGANPPRPERQEPP